MAETDGVVFTADPDRLPFGFDNEETTLSWSLPDGSGTVRVTGGEGDEVVVARGQEGSVSIGWIPPGETYKFSLFDAEEQAVASLDVSRDGPESAEELAALLDDRRLYDQASALEQATWGKVHGDEERDRRLGEAHEAAKKLLANKDQLSLVRLLKRSDRKVERILSLGCGSGRIERALLREGIGTAADGIDISPHSIDEARAHAEEQELPIEYRAADLNFAELPVGTYDLVVATTALHHLLGLEHVLDEVARSLKPDGLLWVDDFVGETQFQWLDVRMEVANALINGLPEHLRWDAVEDRPLEKVVRRKPGTLASPFESIRSAEIPALLRERFDVLEQQESGAVVPLVCPPGTYVAYAATHEDRARFARMLELDRLLISEGVMPPLAGRYLLQRR